MNKFHQFVFNMDRITFYVNKDKCSVGSEVDSDTSLNDYIRNHLNLRGTKYMCKEGGCGSCVVAVTVSDPHPRTFSVNSCLVSVTSCQDWEITTIEGIGDRSRGYHPVQKTLAEYNGTQCGYCSPGFVMSMYSLLEANHYDLTQYEIENSFGSNTCRCTGSRPILDAFKSFAKDAPKPPPKSILDIEDLKICKGKQDCHGCDKNWCVVKHSDAEPPRIKKINLKDGHVWYRVNEITDIFTVLDSEGYESYMLVNGNTGRGEFIETFIDKHPTVQYNYGKGDEHHNDHHHTTLWGNVSISSLPNLGAVFSGMFAEARLDDFYAVMRKRCASMLKRFRGSPNNILTTLADKIDGPFIRHWAGRHVRTGVHVTN